MARAGDVTCPECGSRNLEYGDPYTKLDRIEQPMHCRACGHGWLEK